MKKFIILVALFLSLSLAKAQKKQNVYFFKNNGKEVLIKDSADFARIIEEPDSGETNFILKEYYANGNRKTLGKVSSFEPNLIFEDIVLRYNKAGKRISHIVYEKGVPLGMAYYYFGNGKIHKQVEHIPFMQVANEVIGNAREIVTTNELFSNLLSSPNTKLIYLADSLGSEYVKEGNGHFKDVIIVEKGEQVEEGNYKEGVKDGEWKGYDTGSNSNFIETYQMGKLIKGETIKDGKPYPYTNAMQVPEFKGGSNEFYRYIGSSMRYPMDAVKDNVTGSVLLEYTIDKDGKIVDVEVLRSVHPSLDREAKRVLMSAPKWVPAAQRGIPVRVKYKIPIKFSISGS